MTDTILLDTHRRFKRLTAVGFTPEQAEEQTAMIAELIEHRLVTRDYLDARLRDFQESMMKDARQEMREMEYRITIRLGGMVIASFGALAALVSVLAYVD